MSHRNELLTHLALFAGQVLAVSVLAYWVMH